MKILYLSDIHFGRELSANGQFGKRTDIQNQLIQVVADLPQNMRPDYIVVTGDIVWTGTEEEYEMAYEWFSRLLSGIGLSGDRIAFCVGNHDVNRKTAVRIPVSELKNGKGLNLNKIDELYQYENMHPFEVQIQAYNDFCHRLGVLPYQYDCVNDRIPMSDKFGFSNQWYSYAVGKKDIIWGEEKYRIVAFNTAMLSGYEEIPDDETFLGLPQIEKMLSDKVIGKESDFYKIALFHHSERFLNTNEMNSYGDRPATLYKLMDNVELALCGHTETGAIPVPRKTGDGGELLNGGAAYYSDDHPNSFSVLYIEPDTKEVDICTFFYSKGKWCPQKNLSDITWKDQVCEMHFPDGNFLNESWKFVLFAGGNKKEIDLKHVDFGLYINGPEIHYRFVNRKDVARLLEFSGDEETVSFGMAPGRERSVTAILEHSSISYFVDQQLKSGQKQVEYELKDPKGTVVSKGIMPHIKCSDQEYLFYDYLQRLRNLEEAFHVRFSVPDSMSVQDQCAITILEDFLEDGGGVFADVTQNKFVYFSENRCEFQQVYEKVSKKEVEVICIGYSAPMICNLFGAKIKLGNCKIIVVNLVPSDLDEVKKQVDTFIEGDRRRLVMKYLNNNQQIVIFPEGSEDKSPVVKGLRKQIEDNALNFEVEPQKLIFGNGIFAPDEMEAKKQGIELKSTLMSMVEVHRQLWKNT